MSLVCVRWGMIVFVVLQRATGALVGGHGNGRQLFLLLLTFLVCIYTVKLHPNWGFLAAWEQYTSPTRPLTTLQLPS